MINQHEERTVGGRHWHEDLVQAAAARELRLLTPPVSKRTVIGDATEAARGLDEWGSADATALATIYATYLTTLEGARP